MRRPKLGSIYRRGEVWWVKYYRDGQPFGNPATAKTMPTRNAC